MKNSFYLHSHKLIKAQLFPDLPQTGDFDDFKLSITPLSYFYINPESWSDGKTGNWVKHQIPGRSDPMQQWLAGGARIVSFDALVSKDLADDGWSTRSTDTESNSYSPTSVGAISITKKIGNIGRQIFNIPDISFNTQTSIAGRDEDHPLDISKHLDYYRSFLYPQVHASGKTQSPYLARLFIGKTLGKRTTDESSFTVDKLDIKITKQYPDLTPIEAIASFTLSEIVDNNLSYSDILS